MSIIRRKDARGKSRWRNWKFKLGKGGGEEDAGLQDAQEGRDKPDGGNPGPGGKPGPAMGLGDPEGRCGAGWRPICPGFGSSGGLFRYHRMVRCHAGTLPPLVEPGMGGSAGLKSGPGRVCGQPQRRDGGTGHRPIPRPATSIAPG